MVPISCKAHPVSMASDRHDGALQPLANALNFLRVSSFCYPIVSYGQRGFAMLPVPHWRRYH
jgi:hypothetical protein